MFASAVAQVIVTVQVSVLKIDPSAGVITGSSTSSDSHTAYSSTTPFCVALRLRTHAPSSYTTAPFSFVAQPRNS